MSLNTLKQLRILFNVSSKGLVRFGIDIHVTTSSAEAIDTAQLHRSLSQSIPCRHSFIEPKHSLDLNAAQLEGNEQLPVCRDAIGIGPEGWMPSDQYEEVKQREGKLKADALEAAESGQERLVLQEHWIFDDFDEEKYS